MPHPTLPPGAVTLTARSSLKVVAVLDPAELPGLAVRDGQPRVVLTIRLPDRVVTASVSAKSARRALATLRENGPDGVSVIVQGRLVNSEITEAGLVVTAKAVKPASAEA